MPLLNYTTSVAVERTLAEIHKALVRHGATAVLYEYERQEVVAVKFKIRVSERELPYRLPADWRAVLQLLREDRKVPRRHKVEAQAKRVAWRVVKDWLEAQLAFLDMRQVTLDQVMLPYLLLDEGQTLYERIRGTQYQLPPANV